MKKFPQINFDLSFEMGVANILPTATKEIEEFKQNLREDELFDKEFWNVLLENEYFLPIFSEFVFDNKKLKDFLKENFEKEIEEKIKSEIKRDFEILSSDNPTIQKISLIYTRNATFFDFFGGEEETIKKFGLNKFYEDKIFDTLKEKDLDNLNLFLLASLIHFDFNGAFYSSDCKRVIGCLLDLNNFFGEEKVKKIFGDEVLYKILKRFDDFYFVLDSNGCFYVNDFVEYSDKLRDFFENENDKSNLIREFYYLTGRIPWDFIEDCDELEETFDEDELEEFAENEGYESFEEMCEENI